jgi:Uma2 family endonuclease
MSTAPSARPPAPPRVLGNGRHRFTADDLLRMVEAGVIGEDDRVELVGGEVFEVTPQGPEHGSLKDDLHRRLDRAYEPLPAHVLDQRPLRAGPVGLPEPDLAVLRGAPRDYLSRHPSGADAVLVVEIAKTSQDRDREKAADYARGGVPVYWLIDLVARTLDEYTEPDAERARYRRIVSLGEDEDVRLPDLGVTWKVKSLLP